MKRIFILVLIASSFLSAGDSMLRISCTEDTVNAQVYINDEYKGSCSSDFAPIDLFLKSGETKIYAVKKVDEDREQRFSKTLYLKPNMPARVYLELSKPILTEEAKKRYFLSDLENAQNGDVSSIKNLIKRYEEGDGTPTNLEQARKWKNVLEAREDIDKANNGDVDAMDSLVSRYEYGDGVRKSNTKANYWRKKLELQLNKQAIETKKQELSNELIYLRKRLNNGQGDNNNISYTESIDWMNKKIDQSIVEGNDIKTSSMPLYLL